MEIITPMKNALRRYRKYIIVFIITYAIFSLSFYMSSYFNDKKVNDIKHTQEKISVDILSIETQFELLQESSCPAVRNSTLSDELNALGDKLSYAESQDDFDSDEVMTLKKYYSLLEIKDYILMRKVYSKCDVRPVSILYFYSNNDDCTECRRQGYVLTRLREEYPDVRVYTFDYNLDLNAVKTLINLYKIESPLPALVINEKTHSGFQSIEDILKYVPELSASSSFASSTKSNKK